MEQVRIELSRAEYRTLLELVQAGGWLINSHRSSPLEKYEAVKQKVFAVTSAAGTGDLLEFDEKEQKLFPTSAFEEMNNVHVDDYDDYTFWEELIERLAMRDAEVELGPEPAASMGPEARVRRLDKFRLHYAQELENHGLDRLKVL